MKLLALVGILIALAGSCWAGNPRLFVHQHTPYADMARLDRELNLIVELGFGGIRTEWGPKELLNAQNTDISNWAKDKVIQPFLKKVKQKGLRLHISLGAPREGATIGQEMAVFRYIMTTTASMFPPEEVSWSIANEPQEWAERKLDRYVVDRSEALVKFWDSSGLHAKGYWLFSPSFHGWQHWDPSPVIMSEEIHKGLDYLQWVYDQPVYRNFLKRVATTFHCYAPPSGYSAAVYAREKATTISRLIASKYVSHPQAITEFNVRYSPKVSMFLHGQKCAEMAQELLKIPALRFASVYCLAGHKEMDFISDKGVRNEDRIKGFKAGMKATID